MADVDRERKLVAVLCADVVGYSRMMGEDEEGTLAALAAHMTELIKPAVSLHHGRIVKTMGDGLLAEFASPVAAARCASEIQEGLRTRNARVPEQKPQLMRVGLSLGDVMVQDGDIFGDAINVAARLQALAEPGTVYASAAVIDQLPARRICFGPSRRQNTEKHRATRPSHSPGADKHLQTAAGRGEGVTPSSNGRCRLSGACHGCGDPRVWLVMAAAIACDEAALGGAAVRQPKRG